MTEHQPREHAVPCNRCQYPTWNTNAICDNCAWKELEETRRRLAN